MSHGITPRAWLGLVLVAKWLCVEPASAAEETRVLFDIPDKIECRDVTPEKCAAAHPTLKVIEAKFRISASFVEGSEASAVDFTYLISSPQMRLKILDYLPNTTLESRYADDLIEVADYTEDSGTSSQEARVGYSIFSLSAVRSQISRKTEQNQYQRIAPKALVLASGTMNRGHGVFFKLRPSNAASLEGAKEFSFLAVVPKAWRGDWCTFVCSARANKKTLLGTSVVNAGVTKVDVGLCLCDDHEAGQLAARLCQIQQENNSALTKQCAADACQAMESVQSSAAGAQLLGRVDDLFQLVTRRAPASKSNDEKLEAARQALSEVQNQLGRLSGAELVESQ